VVDNAVLGLVSFALLVVWSVHLTKLVVQRRRSVRGTASRFRYSLPALLAWSWLAVIASEAALPKLSSVVGWLLPFIAPLIGALLAEVDRPPIALD